MPKQKAIVSVTNDLFTDNRVRKVCEFLISHEFEVTLVGRKLKTSSEMPELPYKTLRFRMLFTRGALFYAFYNIRLFWYLLFHKADLLVSNDLDTLLANRTAKKFKKKCKLVYDSHELYTEVPELINRPSIQRIWKRIEKRCIPEVDCMYTVNESIAGIYQKLYNREVFVVRNIADPPLNPQTKTRKELGLPDNKKIIIYQGAGINIDRGAEELIQAMDYIQNAILVFVGSGDVIEQLKLTVAQKKLNEKILFFDKRPYTELLNFTRISDLGVSIDKNSNLNYRYSLPNKLFDYIHCGIPVLVSDLPEIRKIVDQYDIGIVTESHRPETLAQIISQFLNDTVVYNRKKENTQIAAKELTWKNECRVLEKIYL